MTIQNEANALVKIDVHAVGVHVTSYLHQRITLMVKKLKTHMSFIVAIEVHLKADDGQADRPRSVLVRCALPGEIIVASDTGLRWKIILRNVEKKLLRQLEKKKAMFREHTN